MQTTFPELFQSLQTLNPKDKKELKATQPLFPVWPLKLCRTMEGHSGENG